MQPCIAPATLLLSCLLVAYVAACFLGSLFIFVVAPHVQQCNLGRLLSSLRRPDRILLRILLAVFILVIKAATVVPFCRCLWRCDPMVATCVAWLAFSSADSRPWHCRPTPLLRDYVAMLSLIAAGWVHLGFCCAPVSVAVACYLSYGMWGLRFTTQTQTIFFRSWRRFVLDAARFRFGFPVIFVSSKPPQRARGARKNEQEREREREKERKKERKKEEIPKERKRERTHE